MNIKNNKIAIISFVFVIITAGALYLQNQVFKWEMIYEKSVPDVELNNNLNFNSNNIASGSVTGFVAFDSIEKQPKTMRQYARIVASSETNNGKQLFYIIDIIKMDALAPRHFDPVILTISNVEGSIITLTDGNNNSYIINKITNEVSMFDSTRDVSRLITNQSDFRDFMVGFLSGK